MVLMPATLTPPKRTEPTAADATSLLPKKLAKARPLFDPEIINRAIVESFRKLNPAKLLKNPVIFVVEVGAAITTILWIRDVAKAATGTGFTVQITLWLWFTVLF